MFRGLNAVNLDAKGRLAIPTRYRADLKELCENQLVVTRGLENCLLLYPYPEWEDVENKLVKLPSLDRKVKILQRLLIGHATESEMDGQGRLLLPDKLREFAGLTKRIALVGQLNKFEIWDEEVWHASSESWNEKISMEDLGELSPELASVII